MAPELELFAQPGTRKRASNALECQNGPQGSDIHAGPPVTRQVAGVGAFCERCGAGPIRLGLFARNRDRTIRSGTDGND